MTGRPGEEFMPAVPRHPEWKRLERIRTESGLLAFAAELRREADELLTKMERAQDRHTSGEQPLDMAWFTRIAYCRQRKIDCAQKAEFRAILWRGARLSGGKGAVAQRHSDTVKQGHSEAGTQRSSQAAEQLRNFELRNFGTSELPDPGADA